MNVRIRSRRTVWRLFLALELLVPAMTTACGDGSSGVVGAGPGGPSGSGSTLSTGFGGSGSSDVLIIDASADGSCPNQPTLALGVHMTFNVTWPATIAAEGGTGPVDIWLLGKATPMGQTGMMSLTGTTSPCGTNIPDMILNEIGAAAVCGLGSRCGSKVQIQILPSTFDKITRTYPTSGSQTGWGYGSTITIDPVVALLGLTQASSYVTGSTAWPPYCSTNCAGGTMYGPFATGDVSDDDTDGHPGVTANPKNDTGPNPVYTYPPTTVSLLSTPPLADQVYIAMRNEFQATGMRMDSCTQGTAAVSVSLFENHVIGCHVANPARACTSEEVSFLDQNRPIYGLTSSTIASSSTPITGTAKVQQFAYDATCADVRSTL